ncbi:MAG: hypothetical protein ABIR47_16890 [Candidatus Kapaibacterium sp.]
MISQRITSLHTAMLLIALAFCVVCPTAAPAQQPDPFLVDAKDRRSAATPTPAGLIIGADQPIIRLNRDRNLGVLTNFDADVYYDAWQIGVHRRNQGMMASLMLRTIGRERYSGFFLEVGKTSLTSHEPLPYSPDRPDAFDFDTTLQSSLVYGIGYKGNVGFGDNRMMNVAYEFSVGDSHSRFGDPSYFHIGTEFGLRFPISISALIVGISGFMDMTPLREFTPTIAHPSPDQSFLAGIGLHARYALNFGS